MSERRTVDLASERLTLDELGPRWFRIAAVLGVAGLALGVGAGAAAGDGWRGFYHSWLANFAFYASIGLGGLFFVLVQHLTRAGWSVTVRRFAESVATTLFLPLPLLAIPVLLGLQELFPWADHAKVQGNHLLEAKAAWLNAPFFIGRTVAYFAIWAFLARWFYARSVEQDRSGDPALTIRMERASAPGMLVFALTTTFFAFDYLMSLKPDWYSTIFGVYYFAGCLLGMFALLPIVSRMLQRAGRLQGLISLEHYHDMGKLVFAFVVFWAYIGFSQYMLIWYANIPEETIWYEYRSVGPWATVSIVLILGHFVAPFFFLLSKHMKRRTGVLLTGAVWILLMHWLDVNWLVWPQTSPDRIPWGLVDLGLFVGMGGLFFAFVFQRMSRHALIPVGDPRLPESLQFENV